MGPMGPKSDPTGADHFKKLFNNYMLAFLGFKVRNKKLRLGRWEPLARSTPKFCAFCCWKCPKRLDGYTFGDKKV